MIYIQSYHSRVVGPIQVWTSKKISARESLELPLVCMPRWLSASVVTTALSLTVLLICFSLDSDMNSVLTVFKSIGIMHGVSVRAVRSATYFPTCKAAASHYARSRACNQSNRCILLVTMQSKPSDRDAGGAGASGPWPPARPNPPGSGVGYIPIRLCTTFATYHLISEIYLFWLWKVVYSQKTAYITKKNAFLTSQGPLSRLYTMLYSLKSAI